MTTGKVIILVGFAFQKRDEIRFGIRTLKSNGHDPEVWDLSVFVERVDFPEKIFKNPPQSYVLQIRSKAQLLEEVSRLAKGDRVISTMGYNPWYSFIYQEFAKRDIAYGFSILGLTPPDISKHLYWRRLIYDRTLSYPAYGKKVARRFFMPSSVKQSLAPPNFMLVGGAGWKRVRNYSKIGNVSVIKAHSFEYERYQKSESNSVPPKLQKTHYAVYLDQGLATSKTIMWGSTLCNQSRYYDDINSFFREFEQQTGLAVVVAPHPKSDKVKHKEYFKDRLDSEANLPFLIKNCQTVLAHYSTTIQLAILYRKPIICLESDYYSAYARWATRVFGRETKAQLININQKTNELLLPSSEIDEACYMNFINTYIKEQPSREEGLWDIFSNDASINNSL